VAQLIFEHLQLAFEVHGLTLHASGSNGGFVAKLNRKRRLGRIFGASSARVIAAAKLLEFHRPTQGRVFADLKRLNSL
jgi:hypothetical protein